MNHQPATIIFDMGNVILPFDPMKPCAVLGERIGKTAAEVARLIYHNNLERWFEQGIIDGDGFTQNVSAALQTELSTHEFHDLWANMFTENTGVSRLVQQLKPHHHLMLLSNTNPWHWHYALERFPIISEFQDRILSYEVGVLKPHPAIYRAALEKTHHGDSVIFIDDIETNVAAARIMGIHGIHFQSAEQLKQELLALGCRFD
jgi:putative hydrolase of the HAD superfamily